MAQQEIINVLLVAGVLAFTGCGSDPGANRLSQEPATTLPNGPASPHPASDNPASSDGVAAVPEHDTKEGTMAELTLESVSVELILEDNAVVQDLASHSPIELIVNDHGGKEKVGTLPFTSTGRQDLAPARVEKGEVYLYGSNSLVIFYVSEPNHWGGYTRLGALQDPSVLDAFIGSGETTVTINFN